MSNCIKFATINPHCKQRSWKRIQPETNSGIKNNASYHPKWEMTSFWFGSHDRLFEKRSSPSCAWLQGNADADLPPGLWGCPAGPAFPGSGPISWPVEPRRSLLASERAWLRGRSTLWWTLCYMGRICEEAVNAQSALGRLGAVFFSPLKNRFIPTYLQPLP